MMNESTGKQRYNQIKIEGQLDARWQDWFDGLTVTSTPDSHTILSGQIRDQAALHGVLKRINNLGLTLILVNPQMSDEGQALQHLL